MPVSLEFHTRHTVKKRTKVLATMLRFCACTLVAVSKRSGTHGKLQVTRQTWRESVQHFKNDDYFKARSFCGTAMLGHAGGGRQHFRANNELSRPSLQSPNWKTTRRPNRERRVRWPSYYLRRCRDMLVAGGNISGRTTNYLDHLCTVQTGKTTRRPSREQRVRWPRCE